METWQQDKGLQESAENDMAEAVMRMREDIEAAQWVREHGGLQLVNHDIDILHKFQIQILRELGFIASDVEGYDVDDLQKTILNEIKYLKQKNKYGIKY